MPAELPLVPSATALAIAALLFLVPRRNALSHGLGMLVVAVGTVLPVALGALIDPARATGRALWEWSAIGGPAVRASYRLDPLAVVALALTVAFVGAALATAGAAERRHPSLPALILSIGLVTIALVVTDDLVAATVPLAVVSVLTVLGLLAVAPAAATARAAAYLAIGVQAWVLAALLISRAGSGTFQFGDIPAQTITTGAVLAATLGAILFAGLYPVVAWSFEGDGATDPGPLGSLVLMPAGISATLMLLRLLGASRLEPSRIAVPQVEGDVRLALAVLVVLVVAVSVAMSGRVPLRPIAVGGALIALLVALPLLGWAHLVLLAALLTATYGAVVSLALPDHWEAVRSDLALVAIWVGIATGSPLAIAGGVVALFARAASALIGSAWLVPHRDYIGLVCGSAVFVAGALIVAVGAARAPDPATAILGGIVALQLVAIELVQVGRRFRVAGVPRDLDVTSAVAALLLAGLAAIVAVPLEGIARATLGGPAIMSIAHIAGITAAATLVVVLSRTLRPLLPYFEIAAERSRPAIRALDPVPIGVGTFRALEMTATRANALLGLFERRAGVWLAAVLIVALLIWSVR